MVRINGTSRRRQDRKLDPDVDVESMMPTLSVIAALPVEENDAESSGEHPAASENLAAATNDEQTRCFLP